MAFVLVLVFGIKVAVFSGFVFIISIRFIFLSGIFINGKVLVVIVFIFGIFIL